VELQFSVNKQIISRIDKEKVVADSRKLISLKFTFTEEWDNIIAKTAIITTDNHSYYVNINAEGIVLAEEMPIIKSGFCYFSVFAGYVEDTAELQTANELFIDVIPSGLKEETPAPPTPSKYDEIKGIAENAQYLAKKVRDDAAAGLFVGAKGDPGDKGDTYNLVEQDLQDIALLVPMEQVAEQIAIQIGDLNTFFENRLNGGA
jgi:hypothetical protein